MSFKNKFQVLYIYLVQNTYFNHYAKNLRDVTTMPTSYSPVLGLHIFGNPAQVVGDPRVNQGPIFQAARHGPDR